MEAIPTSADRGYQCSANFRYSWMTSQPVASNDCTAGYSEYSNMCENVDPNRGGHPQIMAGSTDSSCTNLNKPQILPVRIPSEIISMSLADVSNGVDMDGVNSLKSDHHNPPLPLGPIQEPHHVCTNEFPRLEGVASIGSSAAPCCGERCSESGSLLADALGEALPSIIDDMGCTQAALGRVFEVETVARAVQLLGVDQAQLLMYLLKSCNEFLMKNGKRRKGKGGRRPAADPRIDPNIDPKKARRIVANRKSAAKSKEKQRKEATSLKIRHDRKLCQLRAMAFEARFLEECISNIEKENISLDSRAEALYSRCSEADMMIINLCSNKDELVLQQGSAEVVGSDCGTLTHAAGVPCLGTLPTDCAQCMTNASATGSPVILAPPMASTHPQCPFDAPVSGMNLEDCNSRDFLWDFGLQSHDVDMVDWKEW